MTQLSDQALPEGARVGLYEIKNVLHVGKNTITYRAWSHHVNAAITLKEYFPQQVALRNADGLTVTAANAGEQANFQNGLAGFLELTDALLQVEHDNIVQIHNSLEFNGTAYMIMDFHQAPSLAQHLKAADSYTDTAVINLYLPLLQALQQIHTQNLFHGDIRLENILLLAVNKPLLVGFSVLSVAELYNPDLQPTSTSDLYQLAEVIYQCISRVQPVALFDRLEAVQKGEKDPLKPLATSGFNLSLGLLQSIDALLNLDEQQRPKTAEATITLLQSSLTEQEAEIAASILATEQDQEAIDEEPDIGSGVWFMLFSAVVLLVAFGFWVLPSNDSEPVTSVADAIVETTISTDITTTTQAQPNSLPEPSSPEPVKQVTVRNEALEILEQEEVMLAETESQQSLTEPAQAKPNPETAAKEALSDDVLTESPSAMTHHKESTPDVINTEPLEQNKANSPGNDAVTAKKPKPSVAASPTPTNATLAPLTNWAKGKDLPLPDRIKWHLAEAQKNIDIAQLTTPLENNAYQHYRIVLVLDPKNKAAKAGMAGIVDYYATLISRALDENRLKRASIYLNRAEAVHKNARVIRRLRQRLKEARAN